jgi:hypothetical protein
MKTPNHIACEKVIAIQILNDRTGFVSFSLAANVQGLAQVGISRLPPLVTAANL